MTSTEEVRPRGRPRPQETIDRDIRILKHLRNEGARTRNVLATDLGLSKTKTYLALDRLRRQGLVRKCADRSGKDTIWSSDVLAPCP